MTHGWGTLIVNQISFLLMESIFLSNSSPIYLFNLSYLRHFFPPPQEIFFIHRSCIFLQFLSLSTINNTSNIRATKIKSFVQDIVIVVDRNAWSRKLAVVAVDGMDGAHSDTKARFKRNNNRCFPPESSAIEPALSFCTLEKQLRVAIGRD